MSHRPHNDDSFETLGIVIALAIAFVAATAFVGLIAWWVA